MYIFCFHGIVAGLLINWTLKSQGGRERERERETPGQGSSQAPPRKDCNEFSWMTERVVSLRQQAVPASPGWREDHCAGKLVQNLASIQLAKVASQDLRRFERAD